jgi:hypothetical protein
MLHNHTVQEITAMKQFVKKIADSIGLGVFHRNSQQIIGNISSAIISRQSSDGQPFVGGRPFAERSRRR